MVASFATLMEALPNKTGSLGMTPYERTWVVSSYLIASAIIVPLAACSTTTEKRI
jgi:hypothetical protein